jgi:hypothetical protein
MNITHKNLEHLSIGERNYTVQNDEVYVETGIQSNVMIEQKYLLYVMEFNR